MKSIVTFKEVDLSFSNNIEPTLQGITLDINEGEFVSIIGRSGCGKTSLLRLLTGLLKPTDGEVLLESKVVNEPSNDLSYLFQKPVLLEWRTILENILMPIELKGKVTKSHIEKALQLLRLVGLENDKDKYPYECSGGMMSRAALARALVTDPKLLLMDEPFSALDAITKKELHKELANITRSFKATTVLISHDISEAVFLSDRVIVLGDTPTRIIADYRIPFKHPRKQAIQYDSQFIDIVRQLHEEVEMFGVRQ